MYTSFPCAPILRHRTEEEMRALLSSLHPPLEVRSSSAHSRNDCLTDSIILAMEHGHILQQLDMDKRAEICSHVRGYLIQECGLSPHGYPFLSHDEHFHLICTVLRTHLRELWQAPKHAAETSFTCIVYDRFNRRMAQDATGSHCELVETNPVYSPGTNGMRNEMLLMLYCNTHDNGEGWHYEWIRAQDKAHDPGEKPSPPPEHPPPPTEQLTSSGSSMCSLSSEDLCMPEADSEEDEYSSETQSVSAT